MRGKRDGERESRRELIASLCLCNRKTHTHTKDKTTPSVETGMVVVGREERMFVQRDLVLFLHKRPIRQPTRDNETKRGNPLEYSAYTQATAAIRALQPRLHSIYIGILSLPPLRLLLLPSLPPCLLSSSSSCLVTYLPRRGWPQGPGGCVDHPSCV